MRKSTAILAGLSLAFFGCNHSSGGGFGQTAPASTAAPTSTSTPAAAVPTRAAPTAVPITTPAPSAVPSSLTSSPSDPHLAFALALINASRALYNAPPVLLDLSASTCSLRHSEDLFGCAGHDLTKLGTSYPATGCAHLDFRNGDTCGAAAENQGVSELPDEDQAFQQVNSMMMAEGPPPAGSQNHFSTITNPSYTTVGIGLYVDPQGWLWVTEDFN